uniref:Uncharacterized protein n=1 Tax=Chrysotila carterae TaxID=13221 RepID=A0A7S4EYA7_CHRCT
MALVKPFHFIPVAGLRQNRCMIKSGAAETLNPKRSIITQRPIDQQLSTSCCTIRKEKAISLGSVWESSLSSICTAQLRRKPHDFNSRTCFTLPALLDVAHGDSKYGGEEM